MTPIARRLALPAAAAAVLAALAAAPAHAGAAAPAGSCHRVAYPVTLGPPPSGPAATVGGDLCTPRGRVRGQTVVLFVPGSTYDETYAEGLGQGPWYSAAAAANAAGLATLAWDRPGTGPGLPRPPAAAVTMTGDEWALHATITRLWAAGARRVVVEGFSMGTYIAIGEAATWHDISALVGTAALHTTNPVQRAAVAASLEPAPGTPAGYLTTRPGSRGPDFYNTSFAAPAVIAADEAAKSTVTGGELAGINQVAADPALSRSITVPVLLAVGTRDAINCGPGLPCGTPAAVIGREQADWSPSARLQAFTLPLAGHALDLHFDAPAWFAYMIAWVGHAVGER